jgi:hypothetical protein
MANWSSKVRVQRTLLVLESLTSKTIEADLTTISNVQSNFLKTVLFVIRGELKEESGSAPRSTLKWGAGTLAAQQKHG